MLIALCRVVALLCATSVFAAAECAVRCNLEDCLQTVPQSGDSHASHEDCHHQPCPSKSNSDGQGKICGHHSVETDRIEKAPSKVVLVSNALLLQTPFLNVEDAKLDASIATELIAQSPPTLIPVSLLTTNLRI